MYNAKEVIKKIVPSRLRRNIRHFSDLFLGVDKEYRDMQTSEIFDNIYKKGLWGHDHNGDSISGAGSHNIDIIAPYIEVVSEVLQDIKPDTLVDLGCGDFHVGRNLTHLCRHYKACDISSVINERDKVTYPIANVEFLVVNIAADPLPAGDVACVRQVLQHLSNSEIRKFVDRLNADKPYRYLIVSEHLPAGKGFHRNIDKPSGPNIRLTVNSGVLLEDPPFSLKFKEMRVLCETPAPQDEITAVIRTTLYKF